MTAHEWLDLAENLLKNGDLKGAGKAVIESGFAGDGLEYLERARAYTTLDDIIETLIKAGEQLFEAASSSTAFHPDTGEHDPHHCPSCKAASEWIALRRRLMISNGIEK